jgi:hypothetical protein
MNMLARAVRGSETPQLRATKYVQSEATEGASRERRCQRARGECRDLRRGFWVGEAAGLVAVERMGGPSA